MVHISVAKNLIDLGFDLTNAAQFYLGAISPDAIHMRQDTDNFSKYNTHWSIDKIWHEMDEDEYFSFVVDFINKNKAEADNNFLWGYGVHILTDMYWNKSTYTKFEENYKNDTAPIQDKRMAYYNDTDILDQILFNECVWKEDVWTLLQNTNDADFLDLLSAEEINLWRERTLHWYDSGESQHKNPVKYITKADIENFIRKCSEKIWTNISHIEK